MQLGKHLAAAMTARTTLCRSSYDLPRTASRSVGSARASVRACPNHAEWLANTIMVFSRSPRQKGSAGHG